MWNMYGIAVLVLGLAASAVADVAGEDSFERAIRQADLQWGIHAGDGIGRAEYYGRLMRQIMDGRVSVDYVDRARRPVLSSAVIYGGLPEVERLLQMGADPDGGDHAIPPLIQAMSPCQPQKAALLLRYGADPNGAHREYGFPPLFAAALESGRRCFELLLDGGARADYHNVHPHRGIDENAWFMALGAGPPVADKQYFADRLWQLGVDPLQTNRFDMSAMEFAIYLDDEHARLFAGIIRQKRQAALGGHPPSIPAEGSYFAAIDEGDQDAVMALWKRGRDPRDAILDGINAIEYAIISAEGRSQLFNPIIRQRLAAVNSARRQRD